MKKPAEAGLESVDGIHRLDDLEGCCDRCRRLCLWPLAWPKGSLSPHYRSTPIQELLSLRLTEQAHHLVCLWGSGNSVLHDRTVKQHVRPPASRHTSRQPSRPGKT